MHINEALVIYRKSSSNVHLWIIKQSSTCVRTFGRNNNRHSLFNVGLYAGPSIMSE